MCDSENASLSLARPCRIAVKTYARRVCGSDRMISVIDASGSSTSGRSWTWLPIDISISRVVTIAQIKGSDRQITSRCSGRGPGESIETLGEQFSGPTGGASDRVGSGQIFVKYLTLLQANLPVQ